MTTIVCLTLPGGADDELGAPDPFKGLRALLPKLATPSWVRKIGKQHYVEKPKPESPEAALVRRRKERKADRKAASRFQRALDGEYTRSRSAA